MVRPRHFRTALLWLLPLAGLALLALNRDAEPWQRLVMASAGMLYAMKGAIMFSYSLDEARGLSPWAFFLWPGMDPERSAEKGIATDADAQPVGRGLAYLYCGLALILAGSIIPMSAALTGWLGLIGLLLAVHFGLSEILSSGFRLSGRAVRPLFNRPFAAETLNEFWTKRWNTAFVEMDRRLFLPALLRKFGYHGAIFGVFLVSGLLHEMAISFPAGGGWGLPLVYFALQGALVLAERKLNLRSQWFLWSAVLIPLPLVFTAQFREVLILPLMGAIHSSLVSHSLSWYFDRGLWVVGVAHFLVLVASFQVPTKLKWREELPRLSPFNRKLMYAYGAFIVLTIVTFGAFTLCLHQDLLIGSRPALFFAGFITVFWLLRIGLDSFYYKDEDWPRGAQFVVGHALLTSLFLFLSLTYGALVVWHLIAA
jgi:hypothetical protein